MSIIKIDQLIRTNRKSITLIVGPDGKLIVRAPQEATDEHIMSFVERKSGWIVAKQQEVRTTYPQIGNKEFVNGEGFLYLGKFYRLRIVDQEEVPLKLADFFYLDRSFLPKAKEIFINWYKDQANKVLSDRVTWYSSKMGVHVKKIKITSANKRWGSCNADGTLNFP